MGISERCHPLPCPAVSISGAKIIASEDAGNHVVGAFACEHSHGLDDLQSRAFTLSSTTTKHAQLRMNTTRPMNHQNDFTACRIDISNDFADQLSHDPLL